MSISGSVILWGLIDQHCLFKTEAGDQLSAKSPPLKELSKAL